ncbi:DUF2235 domain-containing protein [Hymenobacter sp. BT186]|uniref:DUF2235 domain-containing protein n=1 Tax=Hymenobacter telluris TaxID=2816474 RepID=A0A939F2C7_9BACT|nr:DUF2235 domain-containing protein [Hymenobacter telluris]MBO0360830.1 DUF2235 domain-containing protein [Hymenobacter telluris]MBW3376859.1 DUF2235 domain-containing protein [Hymenobacter norwichensis]
MSKRLIVLCDGTWNKAENVDRRKRKPTNVMKMVRAIQPVASDGTVQVTYYDEGVGNNPGLDRWLGGGIGAGLDRNIREAYRFLLYNYAPGDSVFFFGFSRGAYSVRSLAGFIQHLGLLPKTHDFFVPEAYALYRQRPPAKNNQTAWQQQVKTFREAHYSHTIAIEFVGVWDTVGALGLPLNVFTLLNRRRYEFHDTRLSPIIRHAYHALAIDEQRRTFQPTLWENLSSDQVLEQRWFAGVHTNVGGGYEHDGLANCSLHWMKEKAVALGLGVDEEFLRFYKPWFGDEMRASMTWFYRVLGRQLRSIGVANNSYEVVDESVDKRRKHTPAAYVPMNLPS